MNSEEWIEQLQNRIAELEDSLKYAYCAVSGSASAVGLDSCDYYKEWLAALNLRRLKMTDTKTYAEAIEKIRELKDKNQELKECWQNSVTECQEQKDRIAELESDLGNTERCEEAQIHRADKAEQRVMELEAHCNDLKNGINKIYLMDGEELMDDLDELCEQLSVRTPRQSLAHIQREAIVNMIESGALPLRLGNEEADDPWKYSIDEGYILEYAEQLTDKGAI